MRGHAACSHGRMRRLFVISAVAVVVGAVSACRHAQPPGVTSLTSVPISYEADASAPTSPSTVSSPSTTGASSAAAAPSICVPVGAEAPLVSPGLDNTVTGGVANTGAPLNYPYPR